MSHVTITWGNIATTDNNSYECAFIAALYTNEGGVCTLGGSSFTQGDGHKYFFIGSQEFLAGGALYESGGTTLQVGDWVNIHPTAGGDDYCVKILEKIFHQPTLAGSNSSDSWQGGAGSTQPLPYPCYSNNINNHGPFSQGDQPGFQELIVDYFSGTNTSSLATDCTSCLGLSASCQSFPGNFYPKWQVSSDECACDANDGVIEASIWQHATCAASTLDYHKYVTFNTTITQLTEWDDNTNAFVATTGASNNGNGPYSSGQNNHCMPQLYSEKDCNGNNQCTVCPDPPVGNGVQQQTASWYGFENLPPGDYEIFTEFVNAMTPVSCLNSLLIVHGLGSCQTDNVRIEAYVCASSSCNQVDWEVSNVSTTDEIYINGINTPGTATFDIPSAVTTSYQQSLFCIPTITITDSFGNIVTYNATSVPGTQIIAPSLSPGTYTWQLDWTLGGSLTSCPGALCVNNGQFTIHAFAVECSVTANTNIIENCNDVILTLDVCATENCSGAQQTAAGLGVPCEASYQVFWYDGPGQTSNLLAQNPGAYPALDTYTTSLPGTSTITAFVEHTSTCCQRHGTAYTFTGWNFGAVTATATSTNETIAGASDGTATVTAIAPNPSLTYIWNNGMTGFMINGLSPGTYTCTITDPISQCSTTVSVTIVSGIIYPCPDSLDVCLNLDTGTFEFTDNNIYSPPGFTPATIAITIKHSNGTIAWPGSLLNPDIYINSDDPAVRTYDEPNKLGKNFSIPIPLSSVNNYIDDIYEITLEWNFDGTSSVQCSKTVYLNASDIELFANITINSILEHDCLGDMESRDNTDYNVSSIPFTFTRIHELFPPASSGLSSPVVSTGLGYISYDLYEGDWSNMITTEIIWNIPPAPSSTVMYIGACVKRTMIGSALNNVACNIDPCGINQHIKKLKNRYDDAVCKRDILNIDKYRNKYQRVIELMNLYILGEGAGCADDYSELWDILEITNLDDITDFSCCGDPRVNMNMAGAGNNTFESITCDTDGGGIDDGGGNGGGNGGGGGGGGGGGSNCPCEVKWSGAIQSSGRYAVGDYVYMTLSNGLTMSPSLAISLGIDREGTRELCFQLYAEPSAWASPFDFSQSPYTDGGLYWNFIPCDDDDLIWGCTDNSAANWDMLATIDDGSCIYTTVEGCTDLMALNYDPLATIDDGSCEYSPPACGNTQLINSVWTTTGTWDWVGNRGEVHIGESQESGRMGIDSNGNVYALFYDMGGVHVPGSGSGQPMGGPMFLRKFDGISWSDVGMVPHGTILDASVLGCTHSSGNCYTGSQWYRVSVDLVVDKINNIIYVYGLRGYRRKDASSSTCAATGQTTNYPANHWFQNSHLVKYDISSDTWSDVGIGAGGGGAVSSGSGRMEHMANMKVDSVGRMYWLNDSTWNVGVDHPCTVPTTPMDLISNIQRYDPITGLWTNVRMTLATVGDTVKWSIKGKSLDIGGDDELYAIIKTDGISLYGDSTTPNTPYLLHKYDWISEHWVAIETGGVNHGLTGYPDTPNLVVSKETSPTIYRLNKPYNYSSTVGNMKIRASKWDGSTWIQIPNIHAVDVMHNKYGANPPGWSLYLNNYNYTTGPNGELIIMYVKSPYSPTNLIVQKYDGAVWITIGENFTGMGWESNIGNLIATDDGKIYVSYHAQGVPGPPNHPGYEIMVLSHCEGCTDATATNYDATAIIDDGSCVYPSGPLAPCTTTNGCTDVGVTIIPDPEFEADCETALALNGGSWDGSTLDGEIDNTYVCNVVVIDASSNYLLDCIIGTMTDITGIKAFGCLRTFNAIGQAITTADFSGMQYLQRVEVSWNQLTSIDLTGCVSMKHVIAEGGMTTTCGNHQSSCNSGCLNPYDGCICSGNCVDHRTLTSFSAPDCLDLEFLYLGGQPLTSIDISNNINLEYLVAGPISGITTFDLSAHDKLTTIMLNFTDLTKLILSEDLDLTAIDYFIISIWDSSSTPALTIAVGAGDVPGTTGGTGAGGLQTRVEYAQEQSILSSWPGWKVCETGFPGVFSTCCTATFTIS